MGFLREHQLLGNDLAVWLTALLVTVAAYTGLRLLLWVVKRRLAKLVGRTATHIDDIVIGALGQTKEVILLVVAVWAGSLTLALPQLPVSIISRVLILSLLLQVGFWATEIITGLVGRYRASRYETDPASVTGLATAAPLLKLVVWTVLLLLGLDNLGVDITALVTGLGIGGIAIALAVQNVLGDLFASFSILTDKPFVLGDFIAVGDFVGTVENIGLKTTRVRSLSGEQVVMSNLDLLTSRLRNYGRMYERRVVFQVGIVYETEREQVRAVPEIIEEIVSVQAHARFDRSHFKEFGNFALVFETVYYVTQPDYNVYMDTQQAINNAILERFAASGIEFAYPTQLLYTAEARSA